MNGVMKDSHFPDPDSGSDFKLDQFLAAPCETFDPHYGKAYHHHRRHVMHAKLHRDFLGLDSSVSSLLQT